MNLYPGNVKMIQELQLSIKNREEFLIAMKEENTSTPLHYYRSKFGHKNASIKSNDDTQHNTKQRKRSERKRVSYSVWVYVVTLECTSAEQPRTSRRMTLGRPFTPWLCSTYTISRHDDVLDIVSLSLSLSGIIFVTFAFFFLYDPDMKSLSPIYSR